MNTTMNGKKIKEIWWPDDNTESGRHIKSIEGKLNLELSASYHGDHDEFWIVEFDCEQMEIARHNPRFVETIIWA